MKEFTILAGALALSIVLGVFPFIRSWWLAYRSQFLTTFLLTVIMAAMMLGVSESADRIIGGDIPGSRRLLRAGMFVLVFVLSLNECRRRFSMIRNAGSGMAWMLGYSVLAIASATYSIGPMVSLWKGFEVLTLSMLAICLATGLTRASDLQRLIGTISVISLFLVMTVLVGVLLYPSEAFHSSATAEISYLGVRGLVPVINPATQGAFAAVLLLSATATLLEHGGRAKKDRFGAILIAGIAVTLLILAHSRTQIIAALVAVCGMIFYSGRIRLGILLLTFGGAGFFYSSDAVLTYIYRGQTEEQFSTFTGRLDFWEIVLEAVRQAPILGRGFYAAQRLMFGSGSVDNTYLEALVSIGMLGLALLLMAIFSTGLKLFRTRPRKSNFSGTNRIWAEVASVYVFLVIRAVTSPTFASMHPMQLYFLLTVIGAAALVRFERRARRSAAAQTAYHSPRSVT